MTRPFIPAPNCCSVEMIYTALGQIIENVFHVSYNTDFDAAHLQAVAGVFNNWDNTYFKTYRHSGTGLKMVRAKAQHANDAALYEYTSGLPRYGSYGGTLLPLNVTVCVKLTSGRIGRSTRGRFYMPGVSSSGVSGQTIIAGGYDNMALKVADLITLLHAADANYNLCILSYRNNKAWRTEAVPYTVTGWSLSDMNTDSMRRRLTGRGPT